MLRLPGAIAGAVCAWAIALAPTGISAFSIGFGVDPGDSPLSELTREVTLQELSGLGTLTPANADGVAFWSLDQPVSILEAGQAIARIDSWDVELKEDPYVRNNVNVTNTSAFTQAYIVTVAMPIPPYSYDRVINSSLGITATDSDGNDALLINLAGANFYRGRVDNVTKLTLDPANLPITTADCPYPAPGCTATTSLGVASLAVTRDVADLIEIILRFALSSGDSVGITSRFEITSSTAAIPEPGTAALVALGVALLAASRRRH